MRLQSIREFGFTPTPIMPDGSLATLPIDPSAGNVHQLNVHGWPPNNIQEYMNSENQSIRDLMLKNVELQNAAKDPNSFFTDSQKAALCGSRYAQTSSEFIHEQMRIDKVLEDFHAHHHEEKVVKSDNTIKFDEDDSKE